MKAEHKRGCKRVKKNREYEDEGRNKQKVRIKTMQQTSFHFSLILFFAKFIPREENKLPGGSYAT
jgi:hypothetical protein